MTKRQRKDPLTRRLEQVKTGIEVHELYNHPVVQAYFQELEHNLIRAMVLCGPEDDEGRRSSALMLQSVDSLKAHLSTKIMNGNKAARELADMDS